MAKTLALHLPGVQRLTLWRRGASPDGVPDGVRGVAPDEERDAGEYRVTLYRNVDMPAAVLGEARLPRRLSAVRCTACAAPLLAARDGGHSVKELPGRDWVELVDCWSCHQSEFAVVASRLTFASDGAQILPRRGELFHRQNMLLVPVADLRGGETVASGGRLYCACGALVGFGAYAEDAAQETSHVGLLLSSVSASAADAAGAIAVPQLAAQLARELLECLEAHGTGVFQIVGAPSARSTRLRLISWRAALSIDGRPFEPVLVAAYASGAAPSPEDHRVVWPDEHADFFAERLAHGADLARAMQLSAASADGVPSVLLCGGTVKTTDGNK